MRIPAIALHIFFLTILSSSSNAQFSLSLTGGLRVATEKVLNAYKNNFSSIQGDTLSASNEVEVFASNVKPEGAVECTLTHYRQPQESLYSWQALILRTEDFSLASRKYNACCMQLKGIMVNTGSGPCRFESDYQSTSENKSFYSTLFTPNTTKDPFHKLRVEVLLESDITEWTVRVMVYDTDHKDTEGSLGR